MYVTEHSGNQTLLLLGVGSGGIDWDDESFSRMVNDRDAREAFVDSALSLLLELEFDGLDINWLMPKCWKHGKA